MTSEVIGADKELIIHEPNMIDAVARESAAEADLIVVVQRGIGDEAELIVDAPGGDRPCAEWDRP